MWQRLVIIAFSLFLFGCQDHDKSTSYTVDLTPLSLQVSPVISASVPRTYRASGYTATAQKFELSTSQTGQIKRLLVSEGDEVKTGDLLIAIDDKPLLAAIKQAETAVNIAEVNVKDRQADIETNTRLREANVVTKDQLRKSQVQLDLAQSQLNMANSELSEQRIRKPYFQISSPVDARIIKQFANQGDLAVMGKPLLALEAIKGLEFHTSLPCKWIDQIQIGDTYEVHLHQSNKIIPAQVSHLVRSSDRVTQTCPVKLSFPKDLFIPAGLSGELAFIVNHESHLLIAESCTIMRAGVKGVFRLNRDNRAQFNPIKAERKWQQNWLVTSGLERDDLVVLDPPNHLRDGTPIDTIVAKKHEK